jgi:hypothetical protein
MSDPRYSDPVNDRSRRDRRESMQPGTQRYETEDDARSGTWAWIVGIAVIVIAMLVYDYNRPMSTATNPTTNPPTTTGSAAAPTPAPPPAPRTP